MVLKLARNVMLAKVAWSFVQKKRAEAERARSARRTWTWLALGAAAGAVYVARKPINTALRGFLGGLTGEEQGEGMVPGGVLPLPVPIPSKKKQAKEARREAAVQAERAPVAAPRAIHVERNAEETLAVPLREVVKDLKH